MKKIIFVLSTLVILLGFICISCNKKSDDTQPYACVSCKKTPDALAANDASNKGIYKGTIAGSSGTIQFDLQNSNSTITAKMIIDGVTITLTSTVAVINGSPYVAPFTGTLNGQPVSITFSVGATGQTPTVTTSSIPGHPNAIFSIIKETSTNLIECFEGTYSTTKPDNGVFNLILSRSSGIYSGVSKSLVTANSQGTVGGTILSNGDIMDGTKKIGTLSGDVITGSFIDNNGKTVTINGQRTL